MKNWKIIAFVVLVAIVGFGIFPFQSEITDLEAKRTTLKIQQKQKSAEFSQLEQLKNPKTGDQPSHATQDIPLHSHQEKLITAVTNITARQNLNVTSYQFAEGKNEALRSNQIKATFNIEGDRNKIFQFLKAVESDDLFLGIESFALGQGRENEAGAHIYAFSVQLYSLFQKE